MANVHDVAAYVLDRFDTGISTMKLQKLCYMAQGWSLALADEPLFGDQFEAWRRGPVCRTLYGVHRGAYSVAEWPRGDAANLTRRERVVVDAMLRNYGGLSGVELSELTHKPGTPWSVARQRAGVSETDASSEVLRMDEIEEHFKLNLLGAS